MKKFNSFSYCLFIKCKDIINEPNGKMNCEYLKNLLNSPSVFFLDLKLKCESAVTAIYCKRWNSIVHFKMKQFSASVFYFSSK